MQVVPCENERQYNDFSKICDLHGLCAKCSQNCILENMKDAFTNLLVFEFEKLYLQLVLAKSEGCLDELKSFCNLPELDDSDCTEILTTVSEKLPILRRGCVG